MGKERRTATAVPARPRALVALLAASTFGGMLGLSVAGMRILAPGESEHPFPGAGLLPPTVVRAPLAPPALPALLVELHAPTTRGPTAGPPPSLEAPDAASAPGTDGPSIPGAVRAAGGDRLDSRDRARGPRRGSKGVRRGRAWEWGRGAQMRRGPRDP